MNTSFNIEELCSLPNDTAFEKVNFILIPDELNEESSSLYGLAMSKIEKKQYNRIILLTESLLPLSRGQNSKKIIVPSICNEIFANFSPANEIMNNSLADFPNIEINDTIISFNERFASVLPFVTHLFPETPILPMINHNLSPDLITEIYKLLNITGDDLLIFSCSLSVGLSRNEAMLTDTAIITELLSQEPNIKYSSSPYANVLNTIALLSFDRHLRPRNYKYKQTRHLGRHIITVKGICTIGFFV